MRLPNGYGSIIKLKGNRRRPYAARITINFIQEGTTGDGLPIVKQKYKYLGYFETQPEALACLVDYNKTPYDIEAKKTTFLEVWNAWAAAHGDKVAKSSMNVYKTAFNKCGRYHNTPFSSLRAAHFQNLIDNSPNYSAARVIKIVCGLLCKHAIKKEIIEKNFAELLELPTKQKKKDKQPFTNEEIKLINSLNTLHADMLKILLYSGMRITELLEMETKNIDIKRRLMVGGVKTEAGINRTIPIHKNIIHIIEKNIGSTYLFESPRGGKYHYSNEGLKLNRYIKSLGIDRTIHETRHTFISQCDRLNIDKVTIKRIVGHSTKDITEQYTHKNDNDLINAIDQFYY